MIDAKTCINDAQEKMDMAVMYLEEALAHIRAGKASTRLLDGIRVDSYGSMVPISNVAAVTTPDARSIAIKPWDKSMFRIIEKAIMDSDLGITPENNGEIIRLGIPPLTEERRKQLAKQCKGEGETAKVSIRNARRDAIDTLKKAVKEGMPEDEQKNAEAKLQKVHDKYIAKIEELLAEKDKEIIEDIEKQEYKYGFTSDIETETIPRGLNEEVVRLISTKKGEPEWMTERRLKAYRHWLNMVPPTWAHLTIPPIDFQDVIYYAAPKPSKKLASMDEVDPELKRTFDKLGIPLEEQMALAGVAVDAVMDSVSVKTTFKETLAEKGIIFCSMSEAIRDYPELIQKYLGSVVPYTDNFYAALNAAVFSDGSFCYIPKGVRCPMELSTYFRINAAGTGQFERTLIVADEGAYVSYLEGCTAPRRDENQLHAAVVEIVVEKDAEVKYSTVQNWYPGDKEGKGGVYNFVTKRGICRENARLSWTQVETGSAITWKYPSCILAGDNSVGEFYSVAMTNHFQQADTGTKMIHVGRNTRSRIVSKGISAGRSENSYRGLVRVAKAAENARNYSQCDSLLIGDKCGAHTFPVIESGNPTAVVEHEATTSKISEEQLFYCNQRGLTTEDAVGLIVNGYAREVLNKLPMEFAVEAQKLLAISLEGSVG